MVDAQGKRALAAFRGPNEGPKLRLWQIYEPW